MQLYLSLLLLIKGGVHTYGKTSFFDLNIDPTETNILSSSSTGYSTTYAALVQRSLYWSKYVAAAVSPNDALKKSAWKKSGGVSPWIVNTTFTAPIVPLKYSYGAAPNIIFVLVDDWGWNDVGYRSNYLSWTTPTIDKLAAEGVKLENYFTSYSCVPTRGALLTGRYPIRLGLWNAREGAELPLPEITLAQELKSAGYRTYMVGKWHLGFSSIQHTPLQRGFDSAYSYFSGFVDYWTKKYGTSIDLHDGNKIVSATAELSASLHNGILMQTKAEEAIADHVKNYPTQPMFLYYAMQLIHGVWAAPASYLARCGMPSTITDASLRNITYNYCALNVMLDEAIANLTCALENQGMADNTVLIVVSDNGGEGSLPGNSYPFKGSKGSMWRGGLSGTGLVHSKLLPTAARGSSYYGQMHVTDWLPTLMGLATGNAWTGGLFGAVLDGVDQWAAITIPGTASPRSEILHYHDGFNSSSIQIDMVKLNLGDTLKTLNSPGYVFQSDLMPSLSAQTCTNPSLINHYCPTAAPTRSPSKAKTFTPSSVTPSALPTAKPSSEPSQTPSVTPSSVTPSALPTAKPSSEPSQTPSVTPSSVTPSALPTAKPSSEPSQTPSVTPSSVTPSALPTAKPSSMPSKKVKPSFAI